MPNPTSHIHIRHDRNGFGLQEQERKANHLDFAERGNVLNDIVWEFEIRHMSWADAHAACGLDDGTLRDGSQSTETLHAALRHLRALPR